MSTATPGTGAPIARSTVRRNPHRAVYDRAVIDAILDAGIFCHVGWQTGPELTAEMVAATE